MLLLDNTNKKSSDRKSIDTAEIYRNFIEHEKNIAANNIAQSGIIENDSSNPSEADIIMANEYQAFIDNEKNIGRNNRSSQALTDFITDNWTGPGANDVTNPEFGSDSSTEPGANDVVNPDLNSDEEPLWGCIIPTPPASRGYVIDPVPPTENQDDLTGPGANDVVNPVFGSDNSAGPGANDVVNPEFGSGNSAGPGANDVVNPEFGSDNLTGLRANDVVNPEFGSDSSTEPGANDIVNPDLNSEGEPLWGCIIPPPPASRGYVIDPVPPTENQGDLTGPGANDVVNPEFGSDNSAGPGANDVVNPAFGSDNLTAPGAKDVVNPIVKVQAGGVIKNSETEKMFVPVFQTTIKGTSRSESMKSTPETTIFKINIKSGKGGGNDKLYNTSDKDAIVFTVDNKKYASKIYKNLSSLTKKGNNMVLSYNSYRTNKKTITDSVTLVNYFKSKSADKALKNVLISDKSGDMLALNLQEQIIKFSGKGKISDTIYNDKISGSSKSDTYTLKNGGNDIVIDKKGNDKYNVRSNGEILISDKKGKDIYKISLKNYAKIEINDKSGRDTLILRNLNKSDTVFGLNIKRNIATNTQGEESYSYEIGKNLYIMRKGGLGIVEIDNYFKSYADKNKDGLVDKFAYGSGKIEKIKFSDKIGYSVNVDTINEVKSNIAAWLNNHDNYVSTDDVFTNGSKDDIQSLISAYSGNYNPTNTL